MQETDIHYDEYDRVTSVKISTSGWGMDDTYDLTSYQYNAAGNLEKVVGEGITGDNRNTLYTSEYVYANGILQNEVYDSGTSYTYDSDGRIISGTHKNKYSGEEILLIYNYNEAGQLVSYTGTYETFTYQYNDMGLISSVTVEEDGGSNTYSTSYTYDKDGNLLKEESYYVDSYIYENGVLIKKERYSDSELYDEAHYTYDENGNLIKWEGKNATYLFEYEKLPDSRTDPATGETISGSILENTLTVSGDVSAASPVYAAVYDENGKMISCEIMNAPATADVSSGSTAKLIWVNTAGLTAKSECIEFDLK